jgi:hypothetical protein
MEIDYTIKGTTLPIIPEGIEYRVDDWDHDTNSSFFVFSKGNFISFGHKWYKDECYILCEREDYENSLYYMVKLSDIIKLTQTTPQYFEYIYEQDKSWKFGKIYKLNKNGKINFESGFEPDGYYSTDTSLFKRSTKEAFDNQNKPETMTRTIKYSDAQRIVDIACETWTEILFGKWGKDIVLKRDIEITEEDYQKMRKACTEAQHKVFDDIFGEDKPQFKIGDWIIPLVPKQKYEQHGRGNKAYEIYDVDNSGVRTYNEIKEKDGNGYLGFNECRLATEEEIKAANVFPDGTPCLVRDVHNGRWMFAYANGKGGFYNCIEKSGMAYNFEYSMKLDMNNLPVNE